MSVKPYLLVSGTMFGLIALGHALRLVFQLPFQVASWNIPLWLSGLACVGCAILSIWAFRLNKR
jgi:hypothetical protein